MSSTPSLSHSPAELYRAWQDLRAERPQLRARDAAALLQVSEGELVASRVGIDAVRLRPDWAALLPALGELGPIMALTRNEHCVHERKGPYREVTVSANGQMGLVVSPDIDLRLFLGGWNAVFAIAEETARGTQRSIQVFDQQGVAVHKVFLAEASDVRAWEPLVERLRVAEQDAVLALHEPRAPAAALVDAQIDAAALREGWAALKDTHHFHALLNKHGAQRTQALRLAGGEWAERLDKGDLAKLFEAAAESGLPIMVFVGNAHCIQIHTGPVCNLKWLDDWFNVLDPEFNLHLKTTASPSFGGCASRAPMAS